MEDEGTKRNDAVAVWKERLEKAVPFLGKTAVGGLFVATIIAFSQWLCYSAFCKAVDGGRDADVRMNAPFMEVAMVSKAPTATETKEVTTREIGAGQTQDEEGTDRQRDGSWGLPQ